MKGIIFNLLEDVVTNDLGAEAWDDVVDAAGVPGAYSAIGSYDDHEFVALLSELPPAAGGTRRERLRWFGMHAMPVLAQRYAVFFSPFDATAPFLLTLNDVIHPEVRKLYPGADVPVFDFDAGKDGTLLVRYRSHRGLCALAEGFILGAAHVFGERASVRQDECALDGDGACVIVCDFSTDRVSAGV